MCWLRRDKWRVYLAVVGLLFFLVLMVLIPVSASAYGGASEFAKPVTVQATPTVDLTVTTLSKEKLAEDVAQGQHTFSNLLWNNAASFLSVFVIVVGALIGYFRWLAEQQNTIRIAQMTAKTERDIAVDNQREASLQTYLDKMSELLLQNGLRKSQQGDDVREIARVRTLSILPQLDPARKKSILRFLYESDLIHMHNTIVELHYVKLQDADLHRATFKGINLSKTNMRYADLSEAELDQANLSGAKLKGANFTQTNLGKADLSETDLSDTNIEKAQSLEKTNLHGAKGLTKEQIEFCKSKGAIVDDDTTTPLTEPPQNNTALTPPATPAHASPPASASDGNTAPSHPHADQ